LNAWSRGHANNQGRDRDHVERRAAARARRTDRRGAARGAGTASRPGRGRAQPRDPRARAPRGDGGPAGRRVRARPLRRGRVMTTTTTQQVQDEPLVIAGRTFRSRLIVGTGKYRDNETMVRAIEASGAEMVTVAVRRVDLDRTKEEGILYHLDAERIFLLPNTAGCYTAEEAVRYARLGRAAGLHQRGRGHRAPPRGRRLRRGHAARQPDRQRPRAGEPVLHPRDQAPALRPGDRGRRRRHRVGRLPHHGAGRRRRADEHRDRGGPRLRRHGARDAPRHRGRPPRLPRRSHASPRGRRPVVATDRHAGRRRGRRRLSVTPGRRAALDVLRAVRRGALADRALADALARLEPRERAWTQELVYGTLRLRGRIDYMLAPLVRR